MAHLLPAAFWSDARHYQIAALASLLAYNLGWIDFGAQPLNSGLALAACLITQALCTYWFRLASFDPRSPLITGLSLSLLLRADEAWLYALAGVIAIGSKFLIRVNGKHIWNPAGFAIVALLVISPHVKLPSDVEVPLFVKRDFGTFYKAMFERAVARESMRAVFVEYAWDMGWCDPCAADPFTNEELVALGARWIGSDNATPFRGTSGSVYVTRLHV